MCIRDRVQAATIIYNDINENYQSIAPRKVIFALTEAGNTATGTALLGLSLIHI